MSSGLGRRHAHHAHERPQADDVSILVLTRHRSRVERPVVELTLAVRDPESIVHEGLAAARTRPSPQARSYQADANDQGLTRFGALHTDGATECVAVIHTRDPRLKVADRVSAGRQRLQKPPGVEGLKQDGVAGLDFKDGWQVAGEVAMQVGSIRSDAVHAHEVRA
jgi:hypothetical protein